MCPDFDVGATRARMKGSLRFPVTVTVREGDDVIGRATIVGRRTPDERPAQILVPDADEELDVEWAQCSNERAPQPVTGRAESKHATEYACGEATVYKTEKRKVKKGEPASRKLSFVQPPKPECWASEAPPAGPASTTAPAAATAAPNAPLAATTTPAAEPTDAGAAADAGNEAKETAETAEAAAPKPDASATPDAGAKPKKKPAQKP